MEPWKGRKPNISYFHPFGCKCFILKTKYNLQKFDSKSDNGTFLGYFETSKASHVKFNDEKDDGTHKQRRGGELVSKSNQT